MWATSWPGHTRAYPKEAAVAVVLGCEPGDHLVLLWEQPRTRTQANGGATGMHEHQTSNRVAHAASPFHWRLCHGVRQRLGGCRVRRMPSLCSVSRTILVQGLHVTAAAIPQARTLARITPRP